MKKFFDKIKNYSFWVSLSASLIMLLNSLGNACGFEVENQVVEDVVMSIASFLAVFGVVSMNGKSKDATVDESDKSDNQKEDVQVEIDAESLENLELSVDKIIEHCDATEQSTDNNDLNCENNENKSDDNKQN